MFKKILERILTKMDEEHLELECPASDKLHFQIKRYTIILSFVELIVILLKLIYLVAHHLGG